ncbi:hypothetical protein C7974DRAFT_412230 [Boeremia exigua]|uniref:uncharacterized protein n=1 Tax=Boeremia exigua TaxID=749465 RepID=UPI001E8E3E26|nr:uncharacterized protein C7974DRAFT_412230 [Boeremia exigua]KAH6633217.1 hypothetical protein C7974DRAFT_412230 [Boeremia exigua]
MRFSTIISGFAFTASAFAAPSIILHNNCDFDVFVTSVGKTSGNTTRVHPDVPWIEEEYFDGTGTAIKIGRTAAALWTAKPTLHLSYTYSRGQSLYYDLSTTYGFDFWGKKITVKGDDDKEVPSIEWDGAPELIQHTQSYFGETGLTLEICAA